ncbi:hypothetical protein GALL_303940 [mine drainage metagenome]|uniref:Uncharacterized protein n=1 Tax=mine drainage metagenome TaxID=410659 RepID=A0A1J5RDN1_9ZZZZ
MLPATICIARLLSQYGLLVAVFVSQIFFINVLLTTIEYFLIFFPKDSGFMFWEKIKVGSTNQRITLMTNQLTTRVI